MNLRFDEVFTVGKTARKAVKQKDYLPEGKFPVIDQSEDFISGYSNDESLVLDFAKPVIIFGDHTRRLKYVKFPFIPGADGTKILIQSDSMDSKFAYYQLQSKDLRDRGYARHFSELRKEEFWVPSIDEQNKIVELLEDHLSRLDAALADVKQAKIKAAQFRRSLLEEVCTGRVKVDGTQNVTELPSGWELRRLGNCLEKLDSGKLAERGWSPQCLSHPVQNDDTWGVLKTTAVQMGDYQPEFNKELPASLAPKTGLEVKPGDFLVTTTGPRNRCGIVCHVKSTPRKLIFSGKILRFRANEDIVLASWLMFVLMSPEYQKTFDRLKVGTSDSSVSIGNQQIIVLDIPVPPIAEQRKLIEMLEEHLSRLEVTLAMADAMEKQSYALRRSVLQAAFSGQLTKEVVSV